jgi:hypothetical protein
MLIYYTIFKTKLFTYKYLLFKIVGIIKIIVNIIFLPVSVSVFGVPKSGIPVLVYTGLETLLFVCLLRRVPPGTRMYFQIILAQFLQVSINNSVHTTNAPVRFGPESNEGSHSHASPYPPRPKVQNLLTTCQTSSPVEVWHIHYSAWCESFRWLHCFIIIVHFTVNENASFLWQFCAFCSKHQNGLGQTFFYFHYFHFDFLSNWSKENKWNFSKGCLLFARNTR